MGNNNNSMDIFYPEAPNYSDIIGVVKLGIKVETSEKQYWTPPFHFMVYKIEALRDDESAYKCACLELGRFHVISGKSNEKDRLIDKLLKEITALIADHIKINVFQENNEALIEEIQTDHMNNFWKVYRVFNLIKINERAKEREQQKTKEEQNKEAVNSLKEALKRGPALSISPLSRDLLVA